MTSAHQIWLPRQALEDGALEERLRRLCVDWSRKWLAGTVMPKVTVKQLQNSALYDAVEMCWSTEDGSIKMAIPGDGQKSLFSLMLSVNLPEEDLSPEDKVLIEGVIRAGVEGLHILLQELFPAMKLLQPGALPDPASTCQGGCFLIAVAFAGSSDPVFQLYVREGHMAQARRALMPLARECDIEGGKHQGLALQRIKAGAIAGRAQLKISEIQKIAVGDIIVLDRDLTEEMELTIDQQAVRQAKCRIEIGEDNVQIIMTQRKVSESDAYAE